MTIFVVTVVSFLIGLLVGVFLDYKNNMKLIDEKFNAKNQTLDVARNYAQYFLKKYAKLVRQIQIANSNNIDNMNEYNAEQVYHGINYVQNNIYPLLTEFSDDFHAYYMNDGYYRDVSVEEIAEELSEIEDNIIDYFDFEPDSVFKDKNDNANKTKNS